MAADDKDEAHISPAAWAGLAFASLVSILALIAIWPQLEQPVILALLLPATAAVGAAAAFALRTSVTLKAQRDGGRAAVADGPRRAFGWRDVIDALPEPAIAVDGTSTILHFNPSARTIFARLRAGVALEAVSRDPELISAIGAAFETGKPQTASLAPVGGSDRRLIANVAPLGVESLRGPERIAVLISLRDLSEQHRLLEMRSDFIANASHELRTPLASVRGFIETLQGPARNDEAARQRFLKIMADQAERMTRLIDDLLLLSRVEEKANLRPTGRTDLVAVIDDVIRSLGPIAMERNATITVHAPGEAHVVAGERDELFQVFQNLIENAVKYGQDGGKVDVEFALTEARPDGRERQRSIVTIRDNGPGIAPEHLPRLTERFYRVNDEYSRKIGGTGLGLAIAKHVLNRHEGELHVESVLGQGTAFKVTLQLVPPLLGNYILD